MRNAFLSPYKFEQCATKQISCCSLLDADDKMYKRSYIRCVSEGSERIHSVVLLKSNGQDAIVFTVKHRASTVTLCSYCFFIFFPLHFSKRYTPVLVSSTLTHMITFQQRDTRRTQASIATGIRTQSSDIERFSTPQLSRR